MNRATQLALNRINQRFYARVADQWSHKRKHAWPGFERVLAAVGGDTQHVLDVGCGDGRFAQFLCERAPGERSYLGLDSSASLLARAARRALGPAFRFHEHDVVTRPVAEGLGQGRYQLITLFGVLHHVPGRRQRAALVQALAQRLVRGGRLVFTIWKLDEDPRFQALTIPFEDYNRGAQESLDLAQLEPGDRLLRWDARADTPRYCNFPAASELSQLIAESELEECERFRADGHLSRMNEYVVLRPHQPA